MGVDLIVIGSILIGGVTTSITLYYLEALVDAWYTYKSYRLLRRTKKLLKV